MIRVSVFCVLGVKGAYSGCWGFRFTRAHKDFDDSDYHSLREIRNSLTHRFLKIKKAPLKENIKNITKKHSLYKQ